jgi:hypothetical protein
MSNQNFFAGFDANKIEEQSVSMVPGLYNNIIVDNIRLYPAKDGTLNNGASIKLVFYRYNADGIKEKAYGTLWLFAKNRKTQQPEPNSSQVLSVIGNLLLLIGFDANKVTEEVRKCTNWEEYVKLINGFIDSLPEDRRLIQLLVMNAYSDNEKRYVRPEVNVNKPFCAKNNSQETLHFDESKLVAPITTSTVVLPQAGKGILPTMPGIPKPAAIPSMPIMPKPLGNTGESK